MGLKIFFRELQIGFFLALRQVRRASLWTTFLIISVMILTFLNLVVVSGVLVGLIEGSVNANKEYYTSDVIITKLADKNYIENTPWVLGILDNQSEIEDYTARYIEGGTVEAGYKERTDMTKNTNSTGAQFVGIDPIAENEITQLKKFIVKGSYLSPGDFDQVLIGSILLKQYFDIEAPGFTSLEGVDVGTKVRIKVNDNVREVTVKGILTSKVDAISSRVFFSNTQLRGLIGRDDYNVDEISIRVSPETDVLALKEKLNKLGIGKYAKVQTYADAEPKFLKDIKKTFALLGNMISSIGLVVASITVFIVIFINAITRRKFIGILKGIGISGRAIEASYMFQSFFYAFCGSTIGVLVLYLFLIPFVDAHPINFPFSDGILVAPPVETAIRVGLLMVTTMIAGYIPARMIVRKNTLDSILGR